MTGDFAGALVLAMLRRALERHGIAAPAPSAGGRLVPLAEKRALLASVLARHGPAAILGVADVVPEFADHPVAALFARCAGAAEAVAGWLAIERYFHSRHRTRILAIDANRIRAEHVDTRGGKISPGEDLAVAGMLCGILRWRGAGGLSLRIGEPAVPAAGLAGPDTLPPATGRWEIGWSAFRPPVAPSPAETPPRGVDAAGRRIDDPLAASLFAGFLEAPHRSPGAEAIAGRLSLGKRTLQRRLADSGWSLSALHGAARIHAACRLLAGGDMPLALVGLVAGYSDQPHFQRAFRAAVGPTPAEYRRLAGDGSAG